MDINELVKAQARVVTAVQERLTDDLGFRPTGAAKDLAIALGIAVDKLDVLIAIRRQGV